jgi:hypothetical protein
MDRINPRSIDTPQLIQREGETALGAVVTRPENDSQRGDQAIIVEGRATQAAPVSIEQNTIQCDKHLLIFFEYAESLELDEMRRYCGMAMVEQIHHSRAINRGYRAQSHKYRCAPSRFLH